MAPERGSEILDGSQFWGKEPQGLPATVPTVSQGRAFPHARGQLWDGPRGAWSSAGPAQYSPCSYSAAVFLSVYLLTIQVIAQPLPVHTDKGDRDGPGHGHTHGRSRLPADQTSNRQREVEGRRGREPEQQPRMQA